jgi:hypothetical protein
MVHKGRSIRGSNHGTHKHPESIKRGVEHHNHKLSERDVTQIRALSMAGLTKTKIGRNFNVSRTTVANVLSGKIWKHVG